MLSKKVQQVSLVVLVLGLVAVGLSAARMVRKYTKDSSAESTKVEDASAYSIYIPSPIERAALTQLSSLWPAVFSPQQPLTATKLPKFYRELFSSNERSKLGLGAAQMAIARDWSISANTASVETLKSALIAPMDSIFGDFNPDVAPTAGPEPKSLTELLKLSSGKGEDSCSLFRLERLFRVAQAWPQFQKEAAERYRSCAGPNDLISVWFDLNALLFSDRQGARDPKLSDSIGQRLTELQKQGSPFDSYMAERLSQAAFLKAAHGGGGLSGDKNSGNKDQAK